MSFLICILVVCVADSSIHSLQRYEFLSILELDKGVIKMDTLFVVRTRILQLCQERKITLNKLATLCALPPSSLKNILYGRSNNPKILTIKMICDGLGITLGQFFSTEEFDALEPEIK